MHPLSRTIKTLIDAEHGFTIAQLCEDLEIKQEDKVPNLLTEKQVYTALKISKQTWVNIKKQGIPIPYSLIHRTRMFAESDVVAYIEQRKGETKK